MSGGPLTIDHVNPTFTITSQNTNVFENEELQKVGRTTGWSYGIVEDTCNDYNINGWVRLCSDRVDFAVQGGDSGSPVFYWKSDGTADLRGIVFGWQGFPYNDGPMSNLGQIGLDLGPLRVHTVQAHITGPTSAPPNSTRTSTGTAFGGKPPFTFAWYRGGVLVSTSSSYTGNVGSSNFELRLNISDALGDTSSDTHPVSIGYLMRAADRVMLELLERVVRQGGNGSPVPSRYRNVLVVFAGVAVLAGCNLITGPTCSLEARPALTVDVRDSTTNAPAGRGARIIARDGAFADTVLVPTDDAELFPYPLAHERAGTYTVTVERDGYRPWSRSGVRVTKDECHVRTVALTARLQP
jgi:hypothetical protein